MGGILGGIQSAAQNVGNAIGGIFGGGGNQNQQKSSSGSNYNIGRDPNFGTAQSSFFAPGTQFASGGNLQTVSPQIQQSSGGGGGGGGGGGNMPSNPNVNQQANGQRWTGTEWVPVGGQGVSQEELNAMNNLFTGSMNYLTNYQQNVIPQWQQNQQQSAQDYFNTQSGLLPGQQQQLLAPIQQNEQAFQGQTESAAAAAQRAYQGLQQQAQAGYGAGSSAGGALNDLAQQQFALNQGQLQQQQGAGQLEFASEKGQVGQFIAQKGADLQNWYNQAKLQIQNDAMSMLQQVNQQIGLTQDAKQQAQLSILQNVQQQNNAIEVANAQFSNQLQLFQATQAQQAANANAGYGNTAAQNTANYGLLQSMFQPIQPLSVSNLTSGNPLAYSGGTGGRNPNDQLAAQLQGFNLPTPTQRA